MPFERERHEVIQSLYKGHFKMVEGYMTTSDFVSGKPHDTTKETAALYLRAIAVLERCREA